MYTINLHHPPTSCVRRSFTRRTRDALLSLAHSPAFQQQLHPLPPFRSAYPADQPAPQDHSRSAVAGASPPHPSFPTMYTYIFDIHVGQSKSKPSQNIVLCYVHLQHAFQPCLRTLSRDCRTTDALLSLAHSPQFQQQLHTFGAALQSGQLDLSQFGLRAAVSAGEGGHGAREAPDGEGDGGLRRRNEGKLVWGALWVFAVRPGGRLDLSQFGLRAAVRKGRRGGGGGLGCLGES